MPTITFSLKDLQNLVGKKLTVDEVVDLAHYGKGDFEGYDKETDEIKIDFGDTNLPYLWSVEGFARLVRLVLCKDKGISKLKIEKGNYKVKVDKSVKNVRPFIAAFVAKGHKIDDYLIKQLIQLQEKLCENFGRRRQKVAIGAYRYDKIKFPVHYKATEPESVKFTPLEFKKEMTQQEILEEHPKGKDYAWILEGCKKYPILLDDSGEVLSFPPVINSNNTGKVEEGDSDLFFEVTGTDMNSVLLASNIFAQAMADRGFRIYSVDIDYGDNKITTPKMFNENIIVKKEDVIDVIGIDIKDNDMKKLIEKAGYDVIKGKVMIPHYRRDILHSVDVVEDIAIMYGYDKIKVDELTSYTIGNTSNMINFIDKSRELLVGLGYQEVMSPILSNKLLMSDRMNMKEFHGVEISNYMSETYSVVRSWLLPLLMDVLGKNKHIEYPQKIFEEGLVTVKKGNNVVDYNRVALINCNEKADYTEAKQAMDYLLSRLGLDYQIEEVDHSSFIPGRVGRVVVSGKKVGYIGEINPKVLENFSIDLPVVGFELNLTEIYQN